jgi:hypothetical protein
MECATFVSRRKAQTICNVVNSLTDRAGVNRRFERGCLIGFQVWFHRTPNATREFVTEKMMRAAQ